MKTGKILSLLSVLSLGVALSGCKTKVDNFDSQIEKMNVLLAEDTLYNQDYKMKVFYSDELTPNSQLIYTKDNEELKKEYFKGNDVSITQWYTFEGEQYIVSQKAITGGNETKIYSVASKDDTLKSLKSDKEYYLNYMYSALREAVNVCKSGGAKACSTEKKLFKKVYTIEATWETSVKNTKEKADIKTVKATIKDGVLLEFELATHKYPTDSNTASTSLVRISFEYSDQTVDFTKSKDYVITSDGIEIPELKK